MNLSKLDKFLEEEQVDPDWGEYYETRETVIAKLGGCDRYLSKYLPKVGTTYKVYVDGYGKYANYDRVEYTMVDARSDSDKEFWRTYSYTVDLEIVSLIPNNSFAVAICERIDASVDEVIQEMAKRAAWFRGSQWLKANAHHLEVPDSGNSIGVDLEGRVTVNGTAVSGTDISGDLQENLELARSFIAAKASRKAAAMVDSDAEAVKNLSSMRSAWEASKKRLASLKKQVQDLGFEVVEKDLGYTVVGVHKYRHGNKGTKFRTTTNPGLLLFAEIKGLKCPPVKR